MATRKRKPEPFNLTQVVAREGRKEYRAAIRAGAYFRAGALLAASAMMARLDPAPVVSEATAAHDIAQRGDWVRAYPTAAAARGLRVVLPTPTQWQLRDEQGTLLGAGTGTEWYHTLTAAQYAVAGWLLYRENHAPAPPGEQGEPGE